VHAGGIVDVDERSVGARLHEVSVVAHAGHDRWQSCSKRLEQCVTATFACGCQRKGVGGLQPSRDFVRRQCTFERDPIAEPRRIHLLAQGRGLIGLVRRPADDRELHVHVLAQASHRFDQRCVPLDGQQMSNAHQQARARIDAQRGARSRLIARLKQTPVHTVGNDRDALLVDAVGDDEIAQRVTHADATRGCIQRGEQLFAQRRPLQHVRFGAANGHEERQAELGGQARTAGSFGVPEVSVERIDAPALLQTTEMAADAACKPETVETLEHSGHIQHRCVANRERCGRVLLGSRPGRQGSHDRQIGNRLNHFQVGVTRHGSEPVQYERAAARTLRSRQQPAHAHHSQPMHHSRALLCDGWRLAAIAFDVAQERFEHQRGPQRSGVVAAAVLVILDHPSEDALIEVARLRQRTV
jgi:hypothetical protein